MTLAMESSETQARVRGAELVRWPDGTRAVHLSTDDGPIAARLLEFPGTAEAAVLAATPAFEPVLSALAARLCERGISALIVRRDRADALEGSLAAAVALLRGRGVARVALAACGADAPGAIDAAPRLGALAVCVLSPSGAVASESLERLRGRPLLIASGGEACAAARELARRARPPCQPWSCEPAPACLEPVAADFSAVATPWVLDALRENVRK